MMKTEKLKVSMILLLAVLLVSSVIAFGVGSTYWRGNPVSVWPGGTRTISIILQNRAGAIEDVVARVEIISGKELASLERTDYLVKAGESVEVPINIMIPKETPVNSTQFITLSTSTGAPSTEGGVSFGIGIETVIEVSIIPEPMTFLKLLSRNAVWIVPLAILSLVILALLIILLVYILRKRKQNKKAGK